MTRRTFVALSATGAAGVALLGPDRALAAASHFDLLSVGYVDGSVEFESLRRAPWPLLEPCVEPGKPSSARLEKLRPRPVDVVPADDLLMGNPELSLETVWMRILGLHPALDATTAGSFSAAFLRVLFPSDDPFLGDFVTAIPWGARGGRHPSSGLPVQFQVPLRVDGGLELVLDVVRPGGAAQRFATAFTVDPVSGMPKIQRGMYLLGLNADTWATPRRIRRPVGGSRDLSLVVSFEPVDTE